MAKAHRHGVPYEDVHPRDVFVRDGWRCYICGRETPQRLLGTQHARAPTVDHVIPLSKGGPHLRSNLRCACKRCNNEKADALVTNRNTIGPDTERMST